MADDSLVQVCLLNDRGQVGEILRKRLKGVDCAMEGRPSSNQHRISSPVGADIENNVVIVYQPVEQR